MGAMLQNTTLLWTAVAAFLFTLLVVVVRRWRRRRRVPCDLPVDLTVDFGSLSDHGPPRDGPQLEFYHVPARVAVLVVAPIGREGTLPANENLPELVGELLPGLAEILARDRPLVFGWPAQLSAQGFSRAFFSNVRLPGNRGRGTPWCSVAGRAELADRQYLIGIVCCTDRPNSLSQVLLDRPSGWLDVVRIRAR